MTEEERKDYLKYIENYTINDLADIFNTQNFVIQDKDKFNEILLYYHFKQNEEIEYLQQENKQLYNTIEELSQYKYDREEEDMMNKEDYFKYYIQGSDHYLIPKDIFDDLFEEMEQLQKENKSLKKENKILRENAEHNDKVVDKVNWENQELKKQLEEYKLITIDYQELEARNKELKEVINKAIEYIEYNNETLYTYEPDYDYEENIVDNYDISNYREDLLKILKGGENE